MRFLLGKYQFLFITILICTRISCDAITNGNLNSNIREFSNTDANATNVKTLQKEDLTKYGSFVPAGKPIKFKEISDSNSSSSSHSRSLLYHEHPGYGLIDYEESPHYGYEYHQHEDDHHDIPDPHGYGYQYNHHHDSGHHHYPVYHHSSHGHYKHHDHALAAKALLWPIAGIALLGAAAALVSNPVLLQLGVVSGRRKRRETEDYEPNLLKQINKIKHNNNIEELTTVTNENNQSYERRMLKRDSVNYVNNKIPERISRLSNIQRNFVNMNKYSKNNDDREFVPVPLKFRNLV